MIFVQKSQFETIKAVNILQTRLQPSSRKGNVTVKRRGAREERLGLTQSSKRFGAEHSNANCIPLSTWTIHSVDSGKVASCKTHEKSYVSMQPLSLASENSHTIPAQTSSTRCRKENLMNMCDAKDCWSLRLWIWRCKRVMPSCPGVLLLRTYTF